MRADMKVAAKCARIMIVDDHPVVRQGIAFMINQLKDMEVVFQAEDAGGALAILERETPDLVLLDISLRKGSGLDLITALRKRVPELRILVMSMHDERLYAPRALQCGANGYVMKEVPAETVIEAVRHVLEGGTYLCPSLKSKIVADAVNRPQRGSVDPMDSLTNRELEIVRLIGAAYSTEKIARFLGISAKTVEAHRLHIKEKLGTATMTELVRYAVQWVEANP